MIPATRRRVPKFSSSPKRSRIVLGPLAESGWKIDEAWPEKQGLSATLTGKSLQLDLTGEFRACVVSLRQT
jgi:hypothetical protein